MRLAILAVLLMAGAASGQVYEYDTTVPSEPGEAPRWVLVVGKWERSSFCVGTCDTEPRWNLTYYSFKDRESVKKWLRERGEWSVGWNGHLIGLWALDPGEMIPVRAFQTVKTVPRKEIIEEHEETIQHYVIGDEEFKASVDDSVTIDLSIPSDSSIIFNE